MASVMRFDEWQDSNGVTVYDGANGPIGGFNASTTITATDASWAVPTLASPIVKVTVIGAGGGGSGGVAAAGNGGASTFDAGGAGTVTAAGGTGSPQTAIPAVREGYRNANGGHTGNMGGSTNYGTGLGGVITVGYLDLTGVSTVNVTIGAGGTGSANGGGNGGRGEVIVEYVAG